MRVPLLGPCPGARDAIGINKDEDGMEELDEEEDAEDQPPKAKRSRGEQGGGQAG